jgi:hypothetical protein
MRQIGLSFDEGLRFTLTRDADQLLLALPRGRWPKHEQPRLHSGLRAHHLSIPLKPRRHGPHAGKLWVHLKYEDGHREEIAAVDPDELARMIEQVEAAIGACFRTKTERVEPEDLVEDGAEVWLPKPSMSELFATEFAKPKREYTFEKLDPQKLLPHIERASPLVLLERRAKEVRQPLDLYCEGRGVIAKLGHFQTWFDGGPAGWFITPYPFLTDDDLAKLVEPLLPPVFWERFYMVLCEMQAPVHRRRLRGAMDAARSPRRESA